MPSEIPKQRTIDALREVWASLDELIGSLDADDWSRPTPLPAWDVGANVAHIIGTEAFLAGERPTAQIDADELEHVHNPIAAMNEAWVASFADADPADIVARFRELTSARLAALTAMSQEQWDEVGFTPAGEDTHGRFMQVRVFDCWMHEQDIRAALDRPGHESGVAVEVSLDEMATAMGFVVGKRAGAPAGSSVTFELTGESGRSIHVVVGERATVVPELDGPATATLTMPVVSFGRIAGGRGDADAHRRRVVLGGDTELAAMVLANLAYTI